MKAVIMSVVIGVVVGLLTFVFGLFYLMCAAAVASNGLAVLSILFMVVVTPVVASTVGLKAYQSM